MTASSCLRQAAQPEGLYDPAFEHDACGVAFVATLSGVPSHTIVAQGLEALRNLDHRGATGADPKTGDGAGILLQVPDAFLRAEVDFELPAAGRVRGRQRLPAHRAGRRAPRRKATIEQIAAEEHLDVLGWRVVPHRRRLAQRPDPVQHAALRAAVRGRRRRAAAGASRWTGWPTACAAAPSTRPGSTSPRCRPAPSSTRAC